MTPPTPPSAEGLIDEQSITMPRILKAVQREGLMKWREHIRQNERNAALKKLEDFGVRASIYKSGRGWVVMEDPLFLDQEQPLRKVKRRNVIDAVFDYLAQDKLQS